jgi:hypothetical protein
MLNNNQLKFVSYSMFILCAINAAPQTDFRGGTILVTTLTKKQFTIAEDSRVRLGYRGHTDDDCKIITLDNKIVFGFAGTRSFDIKAHGPYRPISWEAHSVARRAYRTATDKTAPGTTRQFAVLAKGILEDAVKSLGGWQNFMRATGDAELPLAIFADIGKSGEPEEIVVAFRYSPTLRIVEYTIKPREPTLGDPKDFFAEGTDTSVITSFAYRTGLSFAQDMELRKWETTTKNMSFDYRMSSFAVQLATWQVMYMPPDNPTIGGQIDYIVITPKGGIDDHRKLACRRSND